MKPAKLRARMRALPPVQPKAPPLWVTHDSSPEARTALSRLGAERRAREAVSVAATEAGLVTTHLPYYAGDPVTASARTMQRLAETKGMRTQIIAGLDRCTVEGIDVARGIGFRMHWVRGRATSGTWHEARRTYDMVFDERPVGVHKTAFVGLAKHRPAGMSALHMVVTGGPHGVAIGATQLTAKLKGL